MESQIKIAAKLYQARDTAQKLFKDRYKTVLSHYIKSLKAVMESRGVEEIHAFLEISKTEPCKDSDMVQMLYMAAVVEMIEPS